MSLRSGSDVMLGDESEMPVAVGPELLGEVRVALRHAT